MTVDQADFTWDATPYSGVDIARSATPRRAWNGPTVAVLRMFALLLVASVAILVLLPAAIAAQAASAV